MYHEVNTILARTTYFYDVKQRRQYNSWDQNPGTDLKTQQ